MCAEAKTSNSFAWDLLDEQPTTTFDFGIVVYDVGDAVFDSE